MLRNEKSKLNFKLINEILGVDDSFKAPQKLMNIIMNKEEREMIFKEFLKHESNLDFDWFHIYFQEEHAERKSKKQDFTPDSLCRLLAELVDVDANVANSNLDVAAGTGGLTIKKWDKDRTKAGVFDYHPSQYFYHLEELSDRAIPFLLFNLLIRGMNATVVHGNVLTREVKQVYFIQNDEDDFLGFSNLNIAKHCSTIEKLFSVKKWLEEEKNHIESPLIPIYLERYYKKAD